jgi:hypothetical protein
MKFGRIPNEILDTVLGETYSAGEYTLREELQRVDEDIIDYNHRTEDGWMIFTAWTKTYVMTIADGIFGDRYLLVLPRKPPKQVKKT